MGDWSLGLICSSTAQVEKQGKSRELRLPAVGGEGDEGLGIAVGEESCAGGVADLQRRTGQRRGVSAGCCREGEEEGISDLSYRGEGARGRGRP